MQPEDKLFMLTVSLLPDEARTINLQGNEDRLVSIWEEAKEKAHLMIEGRRIEDPPPPA